MKKDQLIDLAQSLGLNPGKLLKPALVDLIFVNQKPVEPIRESSSSRSLTKHQSEDLVQQEVQVQQNHQDVHRVIPDVHRVIPDVVIPDVHRVVPEVCLKDQYVIYQQWEI